MTNSNTTNDDTDIINRFYNLNSTNDQKHTLGWILGYRSSLYTNNILYESESLINLNGSRYFYLIVNDFNVHTNMNFLSSSSTGLLLDNVLAKITPKKYPFYNESETSIQYILKSGNTMVL